uniref:Reverse transcriptase zinc-binding domain-containing protein n=1 Tax=Brassica oleracea var. oleracea TaxID=109376 RepID=A0A0D3CGG4_BRAOL
MTNEAALRSSMVGLALVMVLVWLWTQSLKKTVITYAIGVSLIAGIVLPDWDFFDRSFSRWTYPVTAEERAAALSRKSQSSRNDQYTVKSGYWVAQNLLKTEEEKEVLQPSITKLQALAWKIKAPQKICRLIWKLIIFLVAATRNLVRCNMRCDNYCPRCGEPEESVTHAIFECSLALQAWSLSTTPTSPNIFPVPSIYAISFAEKQHCRTRTRQRSLSLDYLFWDGSTYGDTKLHSTRIGLAFRSRSTVMGNEEYASNFDMQELWGRL